MADTLRQTTSVLHQIDEATGSQDLRRFNERMHAFEKEASHAEEQLEAVRKLQNGPWDPPLAKWKEEINQRVNDHCSSVIPRLKQAVHKEVDRWLHSNESVEFLILERLHRKIRTEAQASHARTLELLEGVAASRHGGLPLDEDLLRDVQTAGLALEDLFAAFQAHVRERFTEIPDLPEPENPQADIPVKKRFLDYLVFRSAKGIRRRLFGNTFPSALNIPESTKDVRLGPEAASFLHEWSNRLVDHAFRRLVHQELETALSTFKNVFLKETKARLERRADDLETAAATAREHFAERDTVMKAIGSLGHAVEELRVHVRDLRTSFVRGSTAL
jgi:hypothetical protein